MTIPRMNNTPPRIVGPTTALTKPLSAIIVFAAFVTASSCLFAADAEDTVRPGELIIERPTLHSLGFEWLIEGDDNQNAMATVHYRKAGEQEWRACLPLFRTGLGITMQLLGDKFANGYRIPDALVGSIMDLEPGTAYEVRLVIDDPDGVQGEGSKTLKLTTRPEPTIPDEGPVRHVYPPDYKGKKEEPAYDNIMHALNGFRPICDQYTTVHSDAATPGTIIKMHGGLHTSDNHLYWKKGPYPSYWLHGTATLVASGTADQPIYIVAAGDGEPILDGDGCHNLLNLRGADYLHFEGLTIRNTDIAFHCGFAGERGGGSKGITIKNCWIEDIVYGVLAMDGRSEDFNILDNVFIGRNPSDRMTFPPRTISGYAVIVAGAGHSIGYNHGQNFWDTFNVFTGSNPDPKLGQRSRAIDLYNNDSHNVSDTPLEADGGYANIRVLRNRIYNSFGTPLSSQVVWAGPVYFIRNVSWNSSLGKGTLKAEGSAGVYVYAHNTSSEHHQILSNSLLRGKPGRFIVANNIAVGPDKAGNKAPPFVKYPEHKGPKQTVDHNIFRQPQAASRWLVGDTSHPSLDALRKATGWDEHSLTVPDYSLFMHAEEPPNDFKSAQPFVFPHETDLRLKPDAPGVDAGMRVPGINDEFAGKAPDIGAHEVGAPMPVYGPRITPHPERLEALRRGAYVPSNEMKKLE